MALLGFAPAHAAPLARISTVVEAGVAPGAGLVRQGLPRYLAAELARAGADGFPPGTRLELVIREIYLSHDGGMPFGVTNDFSPMPDAITGVTRVLDARGNVLLERRAFATSAPDSGGIGPDNATRRVDALMRALAYWVAREIAR
jgi:hypothetical protein